MSQPSPRWTSLRPHPEQQRLVNSPARFKTVPAGRRSGKTELAKRNLVLKSFIKTNYFPARFFAGAPTRDQAKRIWWDDLKALVPPFLRSKTPSESELTIYTKMGSEIVVVGMDKPERIEGQPWDGGVLDEFGNMKEKAWKENVRPALSDRRGWCWFTGVPEGRNHYYKLDKQAKADISGEWDAFHWVSADILPEEEIAAAKRDLDELTYMQEYEASFISFEGRAYYAFDERYNTARIKYNPKQPLIFCFDFNAAPGVAAVIQEKTAFDEFGLPMIGETISCVIGEVYIDRNSNTPMVCRKLITDWGKHEGEIYVYGDASGGSDGSAKVQGSDWDLVKKQLNGHFGISRVHYRIKKQNPRERARVNSVNSRCRSMEGYIRFLIDPGKAPHVLIDLEGVRLVKGGSGEIDKKDDPNLTHLSDAIGYYIDYEFPIAGERSKIVEVRGA